PDVGICTLGEADGRVRRPSIRLWTVSLRVIDADTGKKVGQEARFRNSWLPGLAKDLLDEAAPKLSKSIRRASKGSSRSRSDDSADDGNLDGSPPPADEPAGDEPEQTADESAAPAAEQPAEGAFEADP